MHFFPEQNNKILFWYKTESEQDKKTNKQTQIKKDKNRQQRSYIQSVI